MTRHFIPIEAIAIAACRQTGCTLDDAMSRNRAQNVVLARELITHMAYANSNMSYPEITRFIRGADVGHSTMITAHQRFRARADSFTVMVGDQKVTYDKAELVERVFAEASGAWREVETIPMAWGNGRARREEPRRQPPPRPVREIVYICSRCDAAVSELFTPRGGGKPVCSTCRWSDE